MEKSNWKLAVLWICQAIWSFALVMGFVIGSTWVISLITKVR